MLLTDRLADGRLLVTECSMVHPLGPAPAAGTIRAEVNGGYTLRQQGKDVVWQIFAEADPGGLIPAWVIDKRIESVAGWITRFNQLLNSELPAPNTHTLTHIPHPHAAR